MQKDKSKLLMIALGKGRKAEPPKDESDGEGLEYGADEPDADERGGEDDSDGDDEYSDDDSIQCAHDLMESLDRGDAQGIVDAIKAIAAGK